MECLDCSQMINLKMTTSFKLGSARVKVGACAKHLKEIMQALIKLNGRKR